MTPETNQFFKDVLFKILPSVFVSIAALACTVQYNNWQREIKKIELANQFFKEIEAEVDPTEQTLALKKEFITRVLNERDPQLFALLDTAIKYNLSAKLMRAEELAAKATSVAEHIAAINILGLVIERARTFSDKSISNVSDKHEKQYEEYKQIKEAEAYNKGAIQDLQNGNVNEAEQKLKKAKKSYTNYPGITAALLSLEKNKETVAGNPTAGKEEADKLKANTVVPLLEQHEIIQEKVHPFSLTPQRQQVTLQRFKQIQ
jgi:hypothetical protein